MQGFVALFLAGNIKNINIDNKFVNIALLKKVLM